MKILKHLSPFVLSFLLIFPTPTFALSEAMLDMFDQNGIYYYNPEGSIDIASCPDGSCFISGTTNEERLWSGIRHLGFTPGQTAAIIGNIIHEGSSLTRQEDAYIIARNNNCKTKEGNPYTVWTYNNEHHDSCMQSIYSTYSAGKEVTGIGLSIVQWSSKSRREGFLKVMEESGLLKYFEGDAYKTYGKLTDDQLKAKVIEETGSENDYWLLWCAVLKFMQKEFQSSYKDFYNQPDDTPDNVAKLGGWVASKYEVCSTCSVNDTGYNERSADAKSIFERYKNGEFASIENGSAPNLISSSGCSTTNITTVEEALPYLQQFIIDTNMLYKTNYSIPNSAQFNQPLNTPRSDDKVLANSSVLSSWVNENLITNNDNTAACWGATYCGQCAALSGWFITMMTDYYYGGGNGIEVVSNLLAKNSDLKVSQTPSPFSIFSRKSKNGNPNGHTGIVLGKTSDGKLITIENNQGSGFQLEVLTATDQEFKNLNATFVDVSSKLKLNHLGKTYE